jgi:hypothetical protein
VVAISTWIWLVLLILYFVKNLDMMAMGIADGDKWWECLLYLFFGIPLSILGWLLKRYGFID